jgi:Ca2+-binding RTX toxin-like protein
MPTPIKWKDSFQVNTGDAALGIQSDARIIGLANGRILVAWTESATGIIGSGAGMNIIGQYLDVEGNPTGSPFQINTLSVADDEKNFDIAATSDGFIIVYVDGDIGTERTSIIWERRQFNGTIDTLRVADETSADYDFEDPQVAVNQLTNQSMVTYTRYENGDADVLGVAVSAAGAAGAGFDVADNDEFPSTESDVAILANGNYIAVFRDFQNGEMEAGWRIMTSAGVPVATFTVATPVIDIKVATLTNGNWVMAFWHGAIHGGDIKFQIWTPTGGTASNTINVVSTTDSLTFPDIVALPDGGFVVLWLNATNATLFARRYTSTGNVDGVIYEVATGVSGEPDLAVTGDGRILCTWTDESSQEVFASIWDPRGATVDAIDYQANDRNFLETLFVTGGVGATTINGNGVADARLIGQDGNDVIVGGANNQTLIGNGGDDILMGGGSDPNSGIGGNIMQGGLGNDTYYVSISSDYIIEAAGQGTDIIYSSADFTLTVNAHVELLATTSIAGTATIDLTGNNLDNTVWGNNGANTLSGGVGGNDTLVGFKGNDIYLVNNVTENIVENAGEGTDIVYVNSSYTLSAHASIELLSTYSIAGTQAYNLTGNNLDNTIWGNRGNNQLSGGIGGNDTLVGFLGDDIYLINNITEVVVENAGEGTDIVYVNSSYTLSAGASIELLSTYSIAGTENYDMTGNNLSNTIWGNRGNNTLSGGIGGTDTLVGFLGNDIYLINNGTEVISELANEGTDIAYASVNHVLSAGASIELLSTDSIAGVNSINLTGNELGQTLWGNNGANLLNGRAGNDTLTGFAGADAFAFTTALGASNVDVISDFSVVDDTIALDDAIFAGIGTPGAFNAAAFAAGAAAADANDRIVYNQATGQLFYDADGNGAGAAVLFATLTGNPALTASDFAVI